jgi:hypothetical protein
MRHEVRTTRLLGQSEDQTAANADEERNAREHSAALAQREV